MKSLYLSWFISQKIESGHWRWVAESLFYSSHDNNKFDVGGFVNSTDRLHVKKLLMRRYFNANSNLRQKCVFEKQVKKISASIETSKYSHVIIYEGSFFELVLMCRLAKMHPGVKFLFNAYDSQNFVEWIQRINQVESGILHKEFKARRNLYMTWETLNLMKVGSSIYPYPSYVFPVFSTLDYQAQLLEYDRRVHARHGKSDTVAISISNSTNLDFILSLIRSNQMNSIRTLLVFQPHMSKRIKTNIERKIRVTEGCFDVDFIDRSLSPYEYLKLLDRCFAWIFTYPIETYKYKSSGRVQDCLLRNVIPIVPCGTALVDQVTEKGNALFQYRYEDIESLLETINLAKNTDLNLKPNLPSDVYSFILRITSQNRPQDSSDPENMEFSDWVNLGKKFPKNNMSLIARAGQGLIRLGMRKP